MFAVGILEIIDKTILDGANVITFDEGIYSIVEYVGKQYSIPPGCRYIKPLTGNLIMFLDADGKEIKQGG